MKDIFQSLVVYGMICAFCVTVDAADHPNILVIFTDDQGWADLSCEGVLDDVRTPHVDSPGADGVRCTAGYVTAPQCSPSRAGLLTGRYQQRFGYDDIRRGPLPLNEITLADRLKKVGYTTGMVGKWHLQPDNSHASWIQRNRQRLVKKDGRPWEFPEGGIRVPFLITWKRCLPGGTVFDQPVIFT
jgi:arylsulfatase A-like enzyme